MTIIRITASDAPRDTILQLLKLARKGFNCENAPRLTDEFEGHYYAEIGDDDTRVAELFRAGMRERRIRYEKVDSFPKGKRIADRSSKPGLMVIILDVVTMTGRRS